MSWLISPKVAGAELSWLTEEGSLTERLKKEFNDVKVDVVYEGIALDKTTDYIREVLIKIHDEPMIFAKTQLKASDLEGAWKCLKTLGQQSLANILFKDPDISRLSLLYRICEPGDILYTHIKSLEYVDKEILWVRQAEWERHGKNILLTEVFLPNLFNQL
jgi:chorismate--pyruvate lyase